MRLPLRHAASISSTTRLAVSRASTRSTRYKPPWSHSFASRPRNSLGVMFTTSIDVPLACSLIASQRALKDLRELEYGNMPLWDRNPPAGAMLMSNRRPRAFRSSGMNARVMRIIPSERT
jgi:hypothetical protein